MAEYYRGVVSLAFSATTMRRGTGGLHDTLDDDSGCALPAQAGIRSSVQFVFAVPRTGVPLQATS